MLLLKQVVQKIMMLQEVRMLLLHHPCDGNVLLHLAALGKRQEGRATFEHWHSPDPPSNTRHLDARSRLRSSSGTQN